MKREWVRPTEGLLIGIAFLCIASILLAIWMPEIYPGVDEKFFGRVPLKFILPAIFAVVFIISLLMGVHTAASYRHLSTEQKIMGFAPMIFCFLGLLFFYFWYGERIQQHLRHSAGTPTESRQNYGN